MKPVWICGVVSVAMLSLVALAQPARSGESKCKMKYSLSGWSAGYSTASGSGTFSEIGDISELFGSYASADVHAGMVRSSAAQVVTKGTVSLAFSGTGKGIDLGVAFGEFVIQKQGAKKTRK